MNPVLSEILASGLTRTAKGDESLKVHSAISKSKGLFIQDIVRELDPTISLEVGLAYGVSALFICDALNVRDNTRHIAIDPNQNGGKWGDNWRGVGIANLGRAGYGAIVRLIESPSYQALPELELAGQRVDFAFIDGWHTFDFTLVDFFFIDRMLNVGGVIAFDDAHWPSVRKVCRFVKTNLAYSVLGVHRIGMKSLIKRGLSKGLSEVWPGLQARCIAFRKVADDNRRWDHFKEF
jgi:predicted O-methyltransferase YrrM